MLAAEYCEYLIVCFLAHIMIGADTSYKLEIDLLHIPESLIIIFLFHKSGDMDREVFRKQVVIPDRHARRDTKMLPRKHGAASILREYFKDEQQKLVVKLVVKSQGDIRWYFPCFTL